MRIVFCGRASRRRRPLAGDDRPNFLPLLERQRLEDGLGSRVGASRNHIKNTCQSARITGQ